MQINWKEVAKSPGYRSLKAAYAHDIRKKNRTKSELLRHFKWVIGRATHYSQKQNRLIQEVLNEWESRRTYWWLNYYQECKQPKLLPKPKYSRPITLRGTIRAYKNYFKRTGFGSKDTNNRTCNEIKRFHKMIVQSTKRHKNNKLRWPNERKRYKRQRN